MSVVRLGLMTLRRFGLVGGTFGMGGVELLGDGLYGV